MRRHWVDQVVDLPFENMKLMAPNRWHQILAWLYGDYMTPPPEDGKRVPTHSSMEIEVYEDVSADCKNSFTMKERDYGEIQKKRMAFRSSSDHSSVGGPVFPLTILFSWDSWRVYPPVRDP